MIQQEIKLYEESIPYKHTPTVAYSATGQPVVNYGTWGRTLFTSADVAAERSRAAICNIKIGSRFRYVNGNSEIEVVSYETNPLLCEDVDGFPAILKARRTHPIDALTHSTFHYTVAELINNPALERI